MPLPIILYTMISIKSRMVQKALLFIFLLISYCLSMGQGIGNYRSLDTSQPIFFGGDFIVFNKDTIRLGEKSFFIDGSLPDYITEKYPFVFNSVNKAVEKLSNGREETPMALHIAPFVYWIDNPDDTAVRVGEPGQPPFGLTIHCQWLKFHGLSNNPQNVVLACNRGQTIGARGNFTMLRIFGDGTAAENITFGNYCNIDLEFPLLPTLNRKKRATAIVQAQLIQCDGDKVFARNSRFISRLNLAPFWGAKRVLFDRCHFESTDDALNGTAVYLNCTFDIYSSKPFYHTTGTGAVFLDCDIRSFVKGEQYFTKANGQLAVIDSRIQSPNGTYIGWRDGPPPETRNYQFNASQNGKQFIIGKRTPSSTIDLTGRPLLLAYRFLYKGKTIYNTYNLLKGKDDWDPMQIKSLVMEAAAFNGGKLTNLPVQLAIYPTMVMVETGKSEITLQSQLFCFGNIEAGQEIINWQLAPQSEAIVRLIPNENTGSCKVVPVNQSDERKEVVIIASTSSGLQAASVISVAPAILPPPAFTQKPTIITETKGIVALRYALGTNYKDQSVITWYRCADPFGNNPIEVAVSRDNLPYSKYPLSYGDVGYYLMATIQPRHIRSHKGEVIRVIRPDKISIGEISGKPGVLDTDFKNLSMRNQPVALPGFFSWGHLAPEETGQRYPIDTTKDAWFYGTGSDGAANISGAMQGRNGQMAFTPPEANYSGMTLTLKAAPFKTAGQGFSVAPLYMDILIKLDCKTMSGYGLRLIRTTKYSNAVDVYFVRYLNGVATQISEAVTTTAFRTLCTIAVEAIGNNLTARVSTTAGTHELEGKPGIKTNVNIGVAIDPGNYGGFGIQFRGGASVVFSHLIATWD